MKKAIFLDRDGVLIKIKKIKNKPYSVDKLKSVKIYKRISNLLDKYRQKYLLIMITNQPNVSRKLIKKSEIVKVNNFIKKKLILDDVFCCFHDDKDNCNCRKPKPGMLLSAKKKWNINMKKSYFIGDRKKDVIAGKKAGCNNIFIDYGYDEILPSKNDCKYVKSIKDIERYIDEK